MGAREKLALFNMLQSHLASRGGSTAPSNPSPFAGLAILDAYAGSGALGIEAISRGATSVTFLEKSPRVAAIIRKNLQSLDLSAPIITGTAEKANLPLFDLILADPPYDAFQLDGISRLTQFLAPHGILALSHPCNTAPHLPGLTSLVSRTYARARLSIYQKTT